MSADTATRRSREVTTLLSMLYASFVLAVADFLCRHRRTHETQHDGQPGPNSSEEDLEAEENDFGSLDELSSPEESMRPDVFQPVMSTSMPPPSSLVMPSMPQPSMAPSQLVQPQMLQHTI
jgi:transcription factor STE12